MIAALNPIAGLGHMLDVPFLRNALIAGTAIGAAAGLVGWFLVLRAQLFTADALSHVAFTGAVGALIMGFDARVGLFVATIVVALLLGLLGPKGRADDVVVGSTFAWILGLGALALAIHTESHSARDGAAGVNVLFGSIYGLDAAAVWLAVAVGLAIVVLTAFVARPLLFASIDEAVAGARGVPVTMLGLGFLALVGAATAEATQAVGALLLLGLLAAPGAIGHRLTARPYRGMVVAATAAVLAVWGGLTLSYLAPDLPPSFAIIAVVTVGYAATAIATAARS